MKKILCMIWVLVLCTTTFCACFEAPFEPFQVTIAADTLNTQVTGVTILDPQLAEAQLTAEGDILLTLHDRGSTVLFVRNHYGEEFDVAIHWTCEKDFAVEGVYETPENCVSVIDFGAVPGDDLEDTVSIQAAIDSLPDGGTVFIPKGVYLVNRLILREGVNLRLEGTLPDYSVSYDDSGAAELINNNEIAILRAIKGVDMFLNHEVKDYGRNGCGNFTISGGMLDMNGMSRGFIFSCAENVTLQNIIFKDCPSNHAIQIGGCSNFVIRDCLFAGYKLVKGSTGPELIQIEQTHPGAMGAVGNTPSLFEPGEIYTCSGITIDGCYFGPSDRFDSPCTAIGHHGQTYKSTIVGLNISNCVFDNCRKSAISYPAYSDVVIQNNTFINDRDNLFESVESPYQINLELYSNGVAVTQQNDQGEDVKYYYSRAYGCIGSLNTLIADNRFVIGSECDYYGAVCAVGLVHSHDVIYEPGMLRIWEYGQEPVSFSGYVPALNIISGLTLRNNTVEVTEDNTAWGFFFNLSNIRGLVLENNTVTGKTYTACSTKFNGQEYMNCRIMSCSSPEASGSQLIVDLHPAGAKAACSVSAGEGNAFRLESASEKNAFVTIRADGGTVSYTTDRNGNLSIEVLPHEGKSFLRFEMPDTLTDAGNGLWKCQYSADITAIFE